MWSQREHSKGLLKLLGEGRTDRHVAENLIKWLVAIFGPLGIVIDGAPAPAKEMVIFFFAVGLLAFQVAAMLGDAGPCLDLNETNVFFEDEKKL